MSNSALSIPVTYRRREVEQLTRQSRSGLYAAMKDGTFPASIRIGERAVVWLHDEVAAVMQARIRGASQDDIRELVASLHAKRTAA